MDEVRRPGRPRDAARDDALLDAARQVLLRDGYAGLSMEKVATLAGVGKPTLYRRWPSRAALVAEAVLHSFLASVPGSPAPGPHATGSQRLADWFRAYAASVGDPHHAAMVLALTAAAAESPHAAESLYRQHTRGQYESLVGHLRAGVASGEFRADADLEAVADALIGSVLYQLLTRTEQAAPARAEHLLQLLLAGLRAPGRPG
ncbi:TetR/AcrR family transcriptional regulator [Streptomyces sp. A10(2020)]|uniref:TetR/AcrR family transcriptional regulator n=1 Tax=Streptomyces sp. A10(2020) TaxID=2782013 RepID=UPI001F5C98B2|nr:TetR/AcrR family transcriptional regulator [Streptomyces sp. A10(2020)]UNR56798.1 TetR/AcrR family transcriptional regulator [Streptomyces sp. A10(2020)]